MKTIRSAYNSQMRRAAIAIFVIVCAATVASQQGNNSKQSAKAAALELPKASLWNHYLFEFQSTGDNGPYRWSAVNGVLPPGLRLEDNGRLSGEINEQQESFFIVTEVDRSGKKLAHPCTLKTETPFTASWEEKAQVNGNRIDGSVKVSNTTGRDFDLTFDVLAVNDIGRATAIGYQHFSLKQNTHVKLPFGDTLSPGNYTVNVDVVGEEPQSKTIFRTRFVTPKLTISTGP